MTWLLMLAGLPRAGAKQSAMITNKSTESEGSFKNIGFNVKTL